jgi:leucyl-tRNA synthetase
VAAFHELVNEIYRVEAELEKGPSRTVLREAIETLVLMMGPFTPHVAEEMWRRLGHQEPEGIVRAAWPVADAEIAKEDELELPVQVNGKVRTRITVPREAAEELVRTRALEAAASYIAGKAVKKIIIVPGRLVNIVVA